MALDALARDTGTQQIVLVSKPPADAVGEVVLDRIAQIGDG